MSETDLLDFSQNINPFGPPPGAIRAAGRALLDEASRYPDLTYAKLRTALGTYLGVDPDSVVPTNGGAEALFLAARAATADGAAPKALVLEPTFSEYAAAAQAAGLEPVRRVARRPETGFRLDPEALADLRGIGLIFLCNPNNPTGNAMTQEDVLGVADRARDAGAALVVDEAFVDFTPHLGVAVESGLFVARSFTKFFAIPGLRLGCLVCPEPDRVRALQPSWSVNAVAAAAGVAAAQDRAFATESIVGVSRLREELFEMLDEVPGLRPFPGAANFLLVGGPDGLPERLARSRVLVRGCEPFPGLGPGYFRVAVRGAEENGRLVTALHREQS